MTDKRKKNSWAWIIVAALIIVVVVIGASYRGRVKEDGKLNVTLIPVSSGEVASHLSTSGYISSNNTKQYYGQGTVDKVYVEKGDKVEKGQLLVKYKSGYEIKSDIAGTVTYLLVSSGNLDPGNAPAIVIEDLEDLKVTVSIGKNSAKLVKVGQTVNIDEKDISFQTTVSYVSPTALVSSEYALAGPAVILEYNLGEYSGNFISGFDLDADILIDHAENVLRAPVEAVHYNNNRFFVYTVNSSNTVQEKEIEIGLEGDNYVEVLSGLDEGDLIIITQSSKLEPGLLVNPTTAGL